MTATPPGWRRLVTIVGLPRSGTTLTTALLGAHSDVLEVYEPWNDRGAGLDSGEPASFATLVARFAPEPSGRSTLVVKETTTSPVFLDRLGELLDDAPDDLARIALVVVRNPFHVFLSMVDAQRDFWGAPDLALNLTTFDRWARRSLWNMSRLAEFAEARDARLVSYAPLVRNAQGAAALTTAVGLAAEPEQADFGAHIDLSRVRGDPKLFAGLHSVSDRLGDARRRETAQVKPMLKRSQFFGHVRRIAHEVAKLPTVCRAADAATLLTAMREHGIGRRGENPAARAG